MSAEQLTIQNSHRPSSDDIGLDALEYLFGSNLQEQEKTVPWVEIIAEQDGAALSCTGETAQIARLQAELTLNRNINSRLCLFVGYLQGLIESKDEALKALPDLRFKAAEAVGLRLRLEQEKLRKQELEEELCRLKQDSESKAPGIVNFLLSPVEANDTLTAILYILALLGFALAIQLLIRGF